ncbi:helix-turn-helix domain-containing protein [Bifidobacterium animalis]|uniref:helix-turn-helix domain-containing protein n=1 Tax=Bifidobacterium animalis TaxID=28025 RepID=UPI003742228B
MRRVGGRWRSLSLGWMRTSSVRCRCVSNHTLPVGDRCTCARADCFLTVGVSPATSRRKAKNLTHLQLARKLNITDRAVSKWETGTMSIMLPLGDNIGHHGERTAQRGGIDPGGDGAEGGREPARTATRWRLYSKSPSTSSCRICLTSRGLRSRIPSSSQRDLPSRK